MEITGAGGSGGGSPLTVTDGITPVVNVTTIDFSVGATVTNGGGGQANVAITGGGGSFSVLVPVSGVVNGVNTVFTFGAAPSVIVLDNSTVMNKQNVAPDSTVNWTGTTTITLTIAPTINIFGY